METSMPIGSTRPRCTLIVDTLKGKREMSTKFGQKPGR